MRRKIRVRADGEKAMREFAAGAAYGLALHCCPRKYGMDVPPDISGIMCGPPMDGMEELDWVECEHCWEYALKKALKLDRGERKNG